MAETTSKNEWRYDHHGPRRKMAEAEGYVMCRRPGLMVHVMSREEWDALSERPVLSPDLHLPKEGE